MEFATQRTQSDSPQCWARQLYPGRPDSVVGELLAGPLQAEPCDLCPICPLTAAQPPDLEEILLH